jgi:hypothetical protein
MVVKDSNLVPKNSEKICCKLCDYSTCRKSQFVRHLTTDKHKKRENDSKMIENDSDLVPKSSNYYECSCGKMYKYDSGYYRHKKKCTNLNVILNNDEIKDKDELIIQLLKQNSELIKDNKEFKNMMIDVIKNGTHHTTISHNNNSNNKTFNLLLFLNETCKDAMNIMDFVILLNYSYQT